MRPGRRRTPPSGRQEEEAERKNVVCPLGEGGEIGSSMVVSDLRGLRGSVSGVGRREVEG